VALANVAGAAPAIPGTANQNAAQAMSVTRDAAGRFEISIPASWDVRTSPPGRDPVALVARAPVAPDTFAPNVTVIAQELPTVMSSADYGRASATVLRTTLHAFRVVAEGEARVGGAPGYIRTFTWLGENGTPLYAIQAYLTHDRLGLIATGSTTNGLVSVAQDAPVLRHSVLSLRALGSADEDAHAAPPTAAADMQGRRDLFAPPEGTATTAGLRPTNGTLPPVPSLGSLPLPPMPPAMPVPPPALGSASSPSGPAAPPLPHLAAVVMGPAPQAVLRSGDTYAIVHQGEHTSWGTVAAIRASGVVLDTDTSTHTISWSGGSP